MPGTFEENRGGIITLIKEKCIVQTYCTQEQSNLQLYGSLVQPNYPHQLRIAFVLQAVEASESLEMKQAWPKNETSLAWERG